MKWVKNFLEGVGVAVVILVGAASVLGIFWVGSRVAAWVAATQVSDAGVTAVVCTFFVVCFGLFYSLWRGRDEAA